MELSFTQGRWNYERWGGFDPISSSNAKPPGVELWAVFDAPLCQVDALWKNLTHTLSGLFCASINFLESSTTYSAPDWGFRASSGSLRYGTLPREAVCTENLTPWLKLLPCRDKAGLAELMDRPSIYRGFYHSQRLHLVSGGFEIDSVDSKIELEQTLTVVLQPTSQRWAKGGSAVQPNWSLSTILGRKVNNKCALSRSSNVYLQLDRGLLSELKTNGMDADFALSESSISNPVFELSSAPHKVIKEVDGNSNNEDSSILYVFFIEKYADAKPFDLALTWKLPVVWSCSQAPLLANRFLTGSGNERGAILISLKSTSHHQHLAGAGAYGQRCNLHINVFQVVPWYVKVYYHTLQIYIDGRVLPASNVTRKMRVSPSEDKVSPGALELALIFPCSLKSAALSLDFDKVCFQCVSVLCWYIIAGKSERVLGEKNPSVRLERFLGTSHIKDLFKVILVLTDLQIPSQAFWPWKSGTLQTHYVIYMTYNHREATFSVLKQIACLVQNVNIIKHLNK